VEAGGEGEAGGPAPPVRRREPPGGREEGDGVRSPAEEEEGGGGGGPGDRLGHARVPPRRAAAQARLQPGPGSGRVGRLPRLPEGQRQAEEEEATTGVTVTVVR